MNPSTLYRIHANYSVSCSFSIRRKHTDSQTYTHASSIIIKDRESLNPKRNIKMNRYWSVPSTAWMQQCSTDSCSKKLSLLLLPPPPPGPYPITDSQRQTERTRPVTCLLNPGALRMIHIQTRSSLNVSKTWSAGEPKLKEAAGWHTPWPRRSL